MSSLEVCGPARGLTLPLRGRISGAKRSAAPRWQAVPWNGWFGVSRFLFTNQSHSTFTPASFTTLRQTAISFLIVASNCSGVPPIGETPSLCSFSVVSGRVRVLVTSLLSRRSEEHTSELQSQSNLVCRLLLE